jgi:hypothetical protein
MPTVSTPVTWDRMLALCGDGPCPFPRHFRAGEPDRPPKEVTPVHTTTIDRIMNEVALYGGLPLRRGDILKLAKEHLGPAVETEPWPYDEARKVMS